MIQVKLVDNGTLGGAKSLFNGGVDELCSSKLKWNKITAPNEVNDGDVVVFTESAINKSHSFRGVIKILILTEPRVINNNLLHPEYIDLIMSSFDYIFTHDIDLLYHHTKFIPYQHGGTWIYQTDIPDKTKLCSFIASNKTQTKGHKFRRDIYNHIGKFSNKVDTYGTITGERLNEKFSALGNYKFSIVVENCISPMYFTEKIIDCFRSKTIPIYWGTDSIDNHFDPNGIIKFTKLNDLIKILDNINDLVYNDKYDSVVNNHKLSEKYMYFEDQFYEWIKNENRT